MNHVASSRETIHTTTDGKLPRRKHLRHIVILMRRSLLSLAVLEVLVQVHSPAQTTHTRALRHFGAGGEITSCTLFSPVLLLLLLGMVVGRDGRE